MNPDHPRFAQWDAAYVLGALSPADRREFEEHLDECPDCRRAIADLAPTVGLLSRVTAEDVEQIDEEQADPERVGNGMTDAAARPVEVLELARERARRRRRNRFVALVAAAVLVIAAVAVPFTVSSLARPGESVALTATTGIPLEASVRITSVAWGTRLDLDCRYPQDDSSDAPEEGWTYVLAVVDASGETESLSTWRAGPGSNSRLSAGTALDVSDIRSVEIRATNGAVLMSYDLPQS